MRNLVKAVLLDAGFSGVFTFPPSAKLCAEPIVVTQGPYDCVERADWGDAGYIECSAIVCRENPHYAYADAVSVEESLQEWDWSGLEGADRMRVVGLAVGAAYASGRDSSMRYLAEVQMRFRVVREHESQAGS